MRSATRLACLVALLVAQISSAFPEFNQRQVARDAQGRSLYIVELSELASKNEDHLSELPALHPRDTRNRLDFRAWHRPQVRALVRRLEKDYQISAVSMTSWAVPTFAAYLSVIEKERLVNDPAVIEITESWQSTDYASWSDVLTPQGEWIPWGKQAVGTDDGNTSSTNVYLLDGRIVGNHPDLDYLSIRTAPVNVDYAGVPEHAMHVAGILVAQMNDVGVRGINPAGDLIEVRKTTVDATINQALDWILYDLEVSNRYGVVNLSASDARYAPNGAVNRYLRRVSNRALVVISTRVVHPS